LTILTVSLYHTPAAAVSAGVYSYIRQLSDIDLDLVQGMPKISFPSTQRMPSE